MSEVEQKISEISSTVDQLNGLLKDCNKYEIAKDINIPVEKEEKSENVDTEELQALLQKKDYRIKMLLRTISELEAKLKSKE
eukprot:CAMPEP_0197004662 /NCGR_PEP_ID=MMETSP1380-20130617/24596_1 /TAXON_ID=5936 /ORGANISM="Euplotes crassus, Strain CT5" /LENGTH=81 /DNA_ID=CAMNT_0042423529 /DNA_START=13 /DNA_END=258 /DNA_ORIENTATION=-